jgi:hypothetical protein
MSRAAIALCALLSGCTTLHQGDTVLTPRPWVHSATVVRGPDQYGLVELSDGMLYATSELVRP